jgi:thiamine-phosphate pyrophosphorylase
MILCAVTDRRRLGEFSTTSAAVDALVHQARAAADAGLDLFQIREPDLPDTALLDVAARVRDATAGSALRVLINDRLDLAIAAGLAGVHLRASSFPATRAREIAPAPFVIGRSVHGVDEAVDVERAGGLDYLILGTIFPSRSKPPDHPLAGLETLSATVRVCRLPILAIGGVSLQNAEAIAHTGAAGLAAIELFLGTAGRLADTVARLRHIFAASQPSA